MRKEHFLMKRNIDHTINTIDTLITRLRDLEEQIQYNNKQPFHNFEKLITDCQVNFIWIDLI